MSGAPHAEPPRVAYLCDHYPAISHTFVLQEVLALRSLGAEVETFSIRRSDPDHLRAAADRAEFRTTRAILPISAAAFAAAHLKALLAGPLRYVRTLTLAIRRGRRSARGALAQLFYFAEAAVLAGWCRERGLTHIHAHFTSPSADVALVAAELAGGTFSFSAHGTDIFVADPVLLAEKVRRARFVVCISDFGRSQLMTLVDDDQWPKLRVVRCGIDLERFDRDREPRGARRPAHLLSVGRLHPVKGHSVLLEALSLLLADGVAAELVHVGDGPLRQRLEARARALRVDGHVTFAGNVGQDAIADFYAAADVFCLPSFGEGIPVVLMEAMAMGLPVVASQVMGVPELVEHGRSGLLVSPGRPDLLAAALRAVIEDPGLGHALAAEARVRVAADHDSERNAKLLLQLFREELAGASPQLPQAVAAAS